MTKNNTFDEIYKNSLGTLGIKNESNTFDDIYQNSLKYLEVPSEEPQIDIKKEDKPLETQDSFIRAMDKKFKRGLANILTSVPQTAVSLAKNVYSYGTPVGIVERTAEMLTGEEHKSKVELKLSELSKDIKKMSDSIQKSENLRIKGDWSYLDEPLNMKTGADLGWWVGQFAEQAPQYIAMAGATIASGGSAIASPLLIGAMEAGSSKHDLMDIQKELKENGVPLSDEKVDALAVGVGAFNAMLEQFSGINDIITKKLVKKGTSDLIRKEVTKETIKSILKQPNKSKLIRGLIVAGKRITTGSEEGVTEGLQQLVSLTANDMAENQSMNMFKSAVNVLKDKSKRYEIWGSVIIGGVLGISTDVMVNMRSDLKEVFGKEKIDVLETVQEKVDDIQSKFVNDEDAETDIEELYEMMEDASEKKLLTNEEMNKLEKLVGDMVDATDTETSVPDNAIDEDVTDAEEINEMREEVTAERETEEPSVPDMREIDETETTQEDEVIENQPIVEEQVEESQPIVEEEEIEEQEPIQDKAKLTDKEVEEAISPLITKLQETISKNNKDEAIKLYGALEEYLSTNKDNLDEITVESFDAMLEDAKGEIDAIKEVKPTTPKKDVSKVKQEVAEPTKVAELKQRTFTNKKGETVTGAILKQTDKTVLLDVNGKQKRIKKDVWEDIADKKVEKITPKENVTEKVLDDKVERLSKSAISSIESGKTSKEKLIANLDTNIKQAKHNLDVREKSGDVDSDYVKKQKETIEITQKVKEAVDKYTQSKSNQETTTKGKEESEYYSQDNLADIMRGQTKIDLTNPMTSKIKSDHVQITYKDLRENSDRYPYLSQLENLTTNDVDFKGIKVGNHYVYNEKSPAFDKASETIDNPANFDPDTMKDQILKEYDHFMNRISKGDTSIDEYTAEETQLLDESLEQLEKEYIERDEFEFYEKNKSDIEKTLNKAYDKQLEEEKNKSIENIKSRMKSESGSISMDKIKNTPLFDDIISIAKYYIKKGVNTIESLYNSFKRDLGNIASKLKQEMKSIYDIAVKSLRDEGGFVDLFTIKKRILEDANNITKPDIIAGVTREAINDVRKENGLPLLPESETITYSEQYEQAKENGFTDEETLLKALESQVDMAKKGSAIIVGATTVIAKRQQNIEVIKIKMKKAKTESELKKLEIELDKEQQSLNDLQGKVAELSTPVARTLNSVQGVYNTATDTFEAVKQEATQNKNRNNDKTFEETFSKEEQQQFKEEHDRKVLAKERLDKALEKRNKTLEEIDKRKATSNVKEQVKQRPKISSEKRQKLLSKKEEILNKLAKLGRTKLNSGLPIEELKLITELASIEIQLGVDSLTELVSNIQSTTTYSEGDIIHALSNKTKTVNRKISETKRNEMIRLSRLKREATLLDDIDKLLTDGEKYTREIKKEPKTQHIKNLEMILELLEKKITDYNKSLYKTTIDEAELTRMTKYSAMLDRQISELKAKLELAKDDVFEETQPKPKKEYPAEIQVKRDEVSKLKKEIAELKKQKEAPAKLQEKITKMENEADRIQKEIGEGKVPDYRDTHKPTKTLDEIIDAMGHFGRAKKRLSEMRRTRNYKSKTAEIKRAFAEKDFSYLQPEVRLPIESRELLEARLEYNSANRLLRHHLFNVKKKNMWYWIGQSLNTMRTVLTMMDLPPILRQGGILSSQRPIKSMKQFAEASSTIFSDKNAKEIWANIQNHRQYEKIRFVMGVELVNLDEGFHNEMYDTELLERVPVAKQVKDASERNFTTFINLQRFATALEFLERFPNATTEELTAMGDYINVASGKGNFGKMASSAKWLSAVLFAPKYQLSLWQSHYYLIKYNNVRRVRNEILKDLFAFWMSRFAMYGLLGLLPGIGLEFDPRKSEFLQLQIGKYIKIDPFFGGHRLNLRLVGRISSKFRGMVSSQKEDTKWNDIIWQFLRYKLNAPVNVLGSAFSGENIAGMPATWEDYLVTPMAPTEVIKIILSDDDTVNPVYKIGAIAQTLIGGSTNVYKKKSRRKVKTRKTRKRRNLRR